MYTFVHFTAREALNYLSYINYDTPRPHSRIWIYKVMLVQGFTSVTASATMSIQLCYLICYPISIIKLPARLISTPLTLSLSAAPLLCHHIPHSLVHGCYLPRTDNDDLASSKQAQHHKRQPSTETILVFFCPVLFHTILLFSFSTVWPFTTLNKLKGKTCSSG